MNPNEKEQSILLTNEFLITLKKIGKYLDQTLLNIRFKVIMQDRDSETEIADIGRQLGVAYDEKNNDIKLGKWLLKLSERARKHIVNFIFIREAFRIHLKELIPKNHPFERFTEIILSILAILWLAETNDYSMHSAPIIVIRIRSEAFEEEGILQSQYWVYFMNNCHRLRLTAKQVFEALVEKVHKILKEEQTIDELAWEMVRWLKARIPSTDAHGLPYYIEKKRHYDIIKAVATLDQVTTTSEEVGKIVGKSYNVVNIAFKELFDKYFYQWWAEEDYLALRLYPYFFRLTITDKNIRNQLIGKFKTINFVKFIKERKEGEESNVVGWVVCPLIVYQQLESYFEQLKRKKIVRDYFIKQIRRHRISYTVSTKKYKPEREVFQLIMKGQEEKVTKIEALDVVYDITKYTKRKKHVFDKEVLTFLASLLARSLGKSIYIWRPLKLIFDLCEEKNVDTADTAAVKYYMNQLERRLRRLKLVRYYLYFRDPVAFGIAIYLEIQERYENEKLQQFIKKIENISEIVTMTFSDRTIMYFPQIRENSVYHLFLKELLQAEEFEYDIYQITHYKDWDVPYNQLYHENFNFESQQWN